MLTRVMILHYRQEHSPCPVYELLPLLHRTSSQSDTMPSKAGQDLSQQHQTLKSHVHGFNIQCKIQ